MPEFGNFCCLFIDVFFVIYWVKPLKCNIECSLFVHILRLFLPQIVEYMNSL